MRVVVFFISFCFFLLGYGYGFSFNTKDVRSAQVNTHSFQRNTLQYFKNNSNNKVAVVTDYTDIELEEDYHTNDDSAVTNQKAFLIKSNLLANWYLAFYHPLSSNSYDANFDTFFCFSTSPIYIKNRVLRI